MTRDGQPWETPVVVNGYFQPSIFHQKCDNKGATLVAVKDTEGNVFGRCLTQAAVDRPMRGDGKRDPTAWLFALKNAAQIGPTKLSYNSGAVLTSG